MPVMECPTCGRRVKYMSKTEIPFRPFCSRRCKLIDLHKWLNEEYRISEELVVPPTEQCPAQDEGKDGSRLSADEVDESGV